MTITVQSETNILPYHTRVAVYSELSMPSTYVDLSIDEIEYTYGEGERLIGTFAYNDYGGVIFLCQRLYELTGVIIASSVAGAIFGAGIGGVIAGGITAAFFGPAAGSIPGALAKADTLMGQKKSYSVYEESTLFGVWVTGYYVK